MSPMSRIACLLSLPCMIAAQEGRLVWNSAADGSGDPSSVIRWNVTALETTRAAAFNPLRETRSLAIVSAAMFDAVNSITERYDPYAVRVPAQSTDSGATEKPRPPRCPASATCWASIFRGTGISER